MSIDMQYELRFKTTLAGQEFLSDVFCENDEEARKVFLAMESECARQEITFVAALLYFCHNNGSYFDDEAQSILSSILKTLKVEAESYWNRSMGSYDPIMNRVDPVDFGTVFPDGSHRVIWTAETSVLDVDSTVRIIKAAREMMLAMMAMPYFNQSEYEMDEGIFDACKTRRIDALFEAGLWPDDKNQFDDEPEMTPAEVLAKYAVMELPVAAEVA